MRSGRNTRATLSTRNTFTSKGSASPATSPINMRMLTTTMTKSKMFQLSLR